MINKLIKSFHIRQFTTKTESMKHYVYSWDTLPKTQKDDSNDDYLTSSSNLHIQGIQSEEELLNKENAPKEDLTDPSGEPTRHSDCP